MSVKVVIIEVTKDGVKRGNKDRKERVRIERKRGSERKSAEGHLDGELDFFCDTKERGRVHVSEI